MGSQLDRAVSATMLVATVAVAGALVYRTMVSSPVGATDGTPERPRFETRWASVLPHGATIMGDASAPVTIVELTDLECPACRGYHSRLQEVVERHNGRVRVVYVPYPLTSIHRFAMAAAQAGDCALDVSPDALRRWIETVYANQDSLGLRSWGAFAAAAGLPDTAAITHCARAAVPRDRVSAGLSFGESLDVTGTPTILVNGWLFRGLPSDAEMDSLVVLLVGSSGVDGSVQRAQAAE